MRTEIKDCISVFWNIWIKNQSLNMYSVYTYRDRKKALQETLNTIKLYVNTIIENHYDIEYAKAEYKEAKKGFRKELERNNDEGILALGDWVNTLNNALEGTEAGVRIIAHGSISKVVLEVIKVWEDLEIREETKLFPFDIDKLIEEDYAGNEVMTNLQISHKSRTME
ncbi:hypothetical protein KAW50_02165 [candidate division WOR-3 bacterium]|nr:hypothetical protein [candidate division WOR-3 bacterium]